MSSESENKFDSLISPLLRARPEGLRLVETHRSDKMYDQVVRLRIPAWHYAVQDRLASTHFVGLDRESQMGLTEVACLKVLRDREGTHPVRDGLLQSSPTSLVDLWYPEVSRRCDVSIPEPYLKAAQWVSDTPFTFPSPYAEMILNAVETAGTLGDDPGVLAWFERLKDAVSQHAWDEAFYIMLRIFDWRGRMYADTRGFLSYQADALSRSILWFKSAIRVDNPEDFFFPYLREAFGVTPDNYEDLLKDPVRTESRCDDQGATLSGACAMDEFMRTGASSFICREDFTFSGGAMLAMMDRSLGLAERCNLLGGPRRNAWMEYAEELIVVCPWLKDQDPLVVRKALAKPAGMPAVYGCEIDTTTRNLLGIGDEDLDEMEPQELSDLVSKIRIASFLQPRFQHCVTLEDFKKQMKKDCKVYLKVLHRMFPEIRRVCQRHRLMQRCASLAGKTLGWTNPLGWHVEPGHWRIKSDGELHRVRDNRERFNKPANGSAPTWIDGDFELQVPTLEWKDHPEGLTWGAHNMDGCINVRNILVFKRLGIQVCCTHDCWGVHAAHLPMVSRVTRQSAVWTFSRMQPIYDGVCEQWRDGTLHDPDVKRREAVTLPSGDHIASHIPVDARCTYPD